MAAIDFPASPTVGQLFAAGNGVTYKWSGVMWIPIGGASMMSIGDTPPASPGNGQLWWNSVLGTLMLYYTDPNSSAWVPAIAATPGVVIQMVTFETGAVATGTTVIPADDTIPQITEGDQYMTLAITPRSATSRLIINVVWIGSSSVANNAFVCLFQDATANALAVSSMIIPAANNIVTVPLRHVMVSGTTSATTFRVRTGCNAAGTTTFNGQASARFFGGAFASSIVITEVTP
jgi:hypothetical protein